MYLRRLPTIHGIMVTNSEWDFFRTDGRAYDGIAVGAGCGNFSRLGEGGRGTVQTGAQQENLGQGRSILTGLNGKDFFSSLDTDRSGEGSGEAGPKAFEMKVWGVVTASGALRTGAR